MQPVKLGQVGWRARNKIADHADHDGIFLDDSEHPVVVACEGTGFNRDCADHSQRLGDLCIARGKSRLIDDGVTFFWPRYTAGTAGIEQMHVCVDDGYRRR